MLFVILIAGLGAMVLQVGPSLRDVIRSSALMRLPSLLRLSLDVLPD